VADPKPKIFAFCNTLPNNAQWYEVMAIAEDGTCLATHICSSPAWGPHDLGVRSDWHHDAYRAHYPDGFEMEWVDKPKEHAGLRAAYALNQEARAAYEKETDDA